MRVIIEGASGDPMVFSGLSKPDARTVNAVSSANASWRKHGSTFTFTGSTLRYRVVVDYDSAPEPSDPVAGVRAWGWAFTVTCDTPEDSEAKDAFQQAMLRSADPADIQTRALALRRAWDRSMDGALNDLCASIIPRAGVDKVRA